MTTATLRPRLSCSTASLYHLPLATTVGLVRDAGFDGVELVIGPETLLRGMRVTERTLQRAGIPALSLHPPLYPFPGWPRDQFRRGVMTALRARDLGCEVAVIHAPKSRTLATPRARQYVAAIDAAHHLATEAGFVIGLETTQRPWDGKPPLLFDDLAYLLRFADEHRLSVTLDTCHAAANGDDLPTVLAAIGPRLRNIHFSDCISRGPGQKPHTHVRPGLGNTVDLAAFLGILAQSHYTGLITCELSPLDLQGWSLKGIRQKLAQTHDFIIQGLASGTVATAQ
jgi:sugar phosphate isomerase/epimerase